MPPDDRLASLKIDRGDATRRSVLPWILLALLVAAGVVAGGWWLRARSAPPEVRTATVREVQLDRGATVLNASGYVTARRQATVSSKVTGRVLEVLIEEGMQVRAGQILARLDDSNARVSLDLAVAEIAAARSAVEETRVRQREAQVALDRLEALQEREIVSEAEVDTARAEVDSLGARIQQQLEQATVAERRAALWQQEIEDREIRAPFAGVVVTKDAQPGEMISPVSAGGGFTRTGIGTIVDMASLEIEVDVNESYINRVASGQQVEAVLDAYPDWEIPAKVVAIVPTADRQRATVKVRIGFDELDPRILPDMGVKVAFREGDIATTGSRSALAIPRGALRDDEGQDIVWVVREGILERRAVRLGEVRDDQAFVISGLAAGERIIVDGPDTLTAGMTVQEVSE